MNPLEVLKLKQATGEPLTPIEYAILLVAVKTPELAEQAAEQHAMTVDVLKRAYVTIADLLDGRETITTNDKELIIEIEKQIGE